MVESEKGYLRWLGRFLSKTPRFLKNIVTGIPEFLGKPRTEAYAGWYFMIFGIIAIAGNIYFNSARARYVELFGKWYFFGLTNIQWSLITLVGFFFLTHGIYRAKETEG